MPPPTDRRTPRSPVRADPRAQDRTIRALMSVVDDLTVEREEEGLLRSTLEHVVGSLGLAGGVTFLLGPDETLVPLAELGLPETLREQAHALALTSLERGRPTVHEIPARGWLAATPLHARQRQVGALLLLDMGDDALSPDLELLEALGNQIGNGLENVRLYAELRASSSRIEMLNRITAAVTSGSDLRTIVPAFAREMAALVPFHRLGCGFVNDSGDYIEVVCDPEGASWGLGDVIPVVGSGPGSVVLNMPLNSRGRSIGILALGSESSGSYDDSTLARLQPLADAVALAFENVRLFQKTRELSITDEVTPLYNFRHFHQILDRELKLVDRYRSVLSLIFVDLDRFKPINDQYGHLRGSRTLREVGFLIRAAVRETDYPSRYGGDEFVIILPQTDHGAALLLAEKLRRLVEGHTFLQEEGINARIGCSLGIATYPADASTKEALIRLADQRMYEDKENRKAGR